MSRLIGTIRKAATTMLIVWVACLVRTRSETRVLYFCNLAKTFTSTYDIKPFRTHNHITGARVCYWPTNKLRCADPPVMT